MRSTVLELDGPLLTTVEKVIRSTKVGVFDHRRSRHTYAIYISDLGDTSRIYTALSPGSVETMDLENMMPPRPLWFLEAAEFECSRRRADADKERRQDNSPARVLWDIGIALAVPLCVAAIVQVFLRASGVT